MVQGSGRELNCYHHSLQEQGSELLKLQGMSSAWLTPDISGHPGEVPFYPAGGSKPAGTWNTDNGQFRSLFAAESVRDY
jgi:hypothetical protein